MAEDEMDHNGGPRSHLPPRLRSDSTASVRSSPAQKSKREELVATPRGIRPSMPYSAPDNVGLAKRSQSLLNPYGSLPRKPQYTGLDATIRLSPDSAEKRAEKLGQELNLATPMGARKALPGRIPLPKAWSSLLPRDDEEASSKKSDVSKPFLSPYSDGETRIYSAETSGSNGQHLKAPGSRKNSIQNRFDELQSSYELLVRENARLRMLIQGNGPSSPRMWSRSPTRDEIMPGGQPGSQEDGDMPFTHPDTEKILQVETKEGDNSQVERVKMAARQIFTSNVLLKSLQEIVNQDRETIADLNNLTIDLLKTLDKVKTENVRLKEEIDKYRQGTPGPGIGESPSPMLLAASSIASAVNAADESTS